MSGESQKSLEYKNTYERYKEICKRFNEGDSTSVLVCPLLLEKGFKDIRWKERIHYKFRENREGFVDSHISVHVNNPVKFFLKNDDEFRNCWKNCEFVKKYNASNDENPNNKSIPSNEGMPRKLPKVYIPILELKKSLLINFDIYDEDGSNFPIMSRYEAAKLFARIVIKNFDIIKDDYIAKVNKGIVSQIKKIVRGVKELIHNEDDKSELLKVLESHAELKADKCECREYFKKFENFIKEIDNLLFEKKEKKLSQLLEIVKILLQPLREKPKKCHSKKCKNLYQKFTTNLELLRIYIELFLSETYNELFNSNDKKERLYRIFTAMLASSGHNYLPDPGEEEDEIDIIIDNINKLTVENIENKLSVYNNFLKDRGISLNVFSSEYEWRKILEFYKNTVIRILNMLEKLDNLYYSYLNLYKGYHEFSELKKHVDFDETVELIDSIYNKYDDLIELLDPIYDKVWSTLEYIIILLDFKIWIQDLVYIELNIEDKNIELQIRKDLLLFSIYINSLLSTMEDFINKYMVNIESTQLTLEETIKKMLKKLNEPHNSKKSITSDDEHSLKQRTKKVLGNLESALNNLQKDQESLNNLTKGVEHLHEYYHSYFSLIIPYDLTKETSIFKINNLYRENNVTFEMSPKNIFKTLISIFWKSYRNHEISLTSAKSTHVTVQSDEENVLVSVPRKGNEEIFKLFGRITKNSNLVHMSTRKGSIPKNRFDMNEGSKVRLTAEYRIAPFLKSFLLLSGIVSLFLLYFIFSYIMNSTSVILHSAIFFNFTLHWILYKHKFIEFTFDVLYSIFVFFNKLIMPSLSLFITNKSLDIYKLINMIALLSFQTVLPITAILLGNIREKWSMIGELLKQYKSFILIFFGILIITLTLLLFSSVYYYHLLRFI